MIIIFIIMIMIMMIIQYISIASKDHILGFRV